MVDLNNIFHENILDYKFSFTEERSAFFGFELMEGGSMAEVIQAQHPQGITDLGAVATVLRSVLAGIQYLHSNGMFHRHTQLTQRREGQQHPPLGQRPRRPGRLHSQCQAQKGPKE
jgi:hypothetical protein